MYLFPCAIVETDILDGPSIPEAVIAVVFHLLLWYINHEVIAMTGWFDRKNMRLSGYNYNSPGTYFLTICVKNRKCLLSRIDESNILEGPILELLPYGKIAAGYINQLHDFYDNISVEAMWSCPITFISCCRYSEQIQWIPQFKIPLYPVLFPHGSVFVTKSMGRTFGSPVFTTISFATRRISTDT